MLQVLSHEITKALDLIKLYSNKNRNKHRSMAAAAAAAGNTDAAEKYNWAEEVKKFKDSKTGVKGLVDAGVTKLPRFFIHPPEKLPNPDTTTTSLDLPTIDLEGVEQGGRRRAEVVEEIRKAAETWGFFRIVNHGVPLEVMERMLEATKSFHEQADEEKKPFYNCELTSRVRFSTTAPESETDAGCWRDILNFVFNDDQLDYQAVPLVCRNELKEYVKFMVQMRETMAELLSEALGLERDYLRRMEYMKSQAITCLYYPFCPEADKTIGQPSHSDSTFLTVLLQDSIGGLQVLHNGLWVDVPPLHGAFVVNIGDLLQMISNDKFISAEHRAVAQPCNSRVSVACFFTPSRNALSKPLMPIIELISQDNPAVYREVFFGEYIDYYLNKGQDVDSALPHFRI